MQGRCRHTLSEHGRPADEQIHRARCASAMLKDQRAPATDRIGVARFLSREEGRALLDRQAHDLLGLSFDLARSYAGHKIAAAVMVVLAQGRG